MWALLPVTADTAQVLLQTHARCCEEVSHGLHLQERLSHVHALCTLAGLSYIVAVLQVECCQLCNCPGKKYTPLEQDHSARR